MRPLFAKTDGAWGCGVASTRSKMASASSGRHVLSVMKNDCKRFARISLTFCLLSLPVRPSIKSERDSAPRVPMQLEDLGEIV